MGSGRERGGGMGRGGRVSSSGFRSLYWVSCGVLDFEIIQLQPHQAYNKCTVNSF